MLYAHWVEVPNTRPFPQERGAARPFETGRNQLDSIAAVLTFAAEREYLEGTPLAAFREVLQRRTNNARGRAERDTGSRITPIEEREEVAAFVRVSEALGGRDQLLTLILLDSVMWLDQALALDWNSVYWGREAIDPRRALVNRASRSRGMALTTTTRSGRERTVGLGRGGRRIFETPSRANSSRPASSSATSRSNSAMPTWQSPQSTTADGQEPGTARLSRCGKASCRVT